MKVHNLSCKILAHSCMSNVDKMGPVGGWWKPGLNVANIANNFNCKTMHCIEWERWFEHSLPKNGTRNRISSQQRERRASNALAVSWKSFKRISAYGDNDHFSTVCSISVTVLHRWFVYSFFSGFCFCCCWDAVDFFFIHLAIDFICGARFKWVATIWKYGQSDVCVWLTVLGAQCMQVFVCCVCRSELIDLEHFRAK